MTVPPLTKCYPDGILYTRMEEVERQLDELSALTFDEIVERAAISSRASSLFIYPECLMHIIRATRQDNRDTRFNRLYPLVLKRAAQSLPRAERHKGDKEVVVDGPMNDLNEIVLHRFRTLIALDREGGERLDFFEVHFDEAIAKLRLKARGKISRQIFREEALETNPDTGEYPVAIERAAGSLDEAEANLFSDPLFRDRIVAAIDDLPIEQKEVITMLMQHIPIEAKDPSTPSISGILGCEPRTVQYRRTRAIERIRKALDLGDDT